jgi:hypothetical protein
MCLSKMRGILLGPGALWLGRWRRASWKIAGVMLPIIRFLVGGVPEGMAWSQRKEARSLIRLSGERYFYLEAFYYCCDTCGVICYESCYMISDGGEVSGCGVHVMFAFG